LNQKNVKQIKAWHTLKNKTLNIGKSIRIKSKRDLSDKDRNIDNLIAQVNELIEDKMSVETFSEGEYLPSVRQVVQDLRSFGVGVKHIGQTIQTVLKHLVGIEGVKVPSESLNRRMMSL
jgi:hypothetical protein